jgi:DNA-binding CsgD family transcriptional regulator
LWWRLPVDEDDALTHGAPLVGRRRELEQVLAAVERASSASACLVLEGEPGIGKTAVLDAAIARAVALGHRVATARPTAAEAPLAFAGLGDLVRGFDPDVLSPGRRRALDVALGREPGEGDPPQAHELGAALVELVEHVAAGTPLVAVIDDLQWLDAATRDVLTFALRRLPATGVCVLVARRTGADAPEFGEVMTLQGLDTVDTGELIRRVTATLPPHLVRTVISGSGGNPLFAIELARSLVVEQPEPGRRVALPASLGTLVAERFRGLPAGTLEALAATALLSRPSVDELDQLGLLAELHAAEAGEIVEVRGRAIRFRHPLLAAAAHDAVTGTRRLELHRRLAEVTQGSERCLHLALGSTRADAAIALELTDAARAESRRGAPVEAAELALLAVELTPTDDPQRSVRHLLASDLTFRAGRTDEALALARGVADHPVAPVDRHRALLAMATIEFSRSDDAETAAELARGVVAEATDPELLADAHTILARAEYTDFERAAGHAEAALALIRARHPVPPLALAHALNATASARFMAGHGLDRAAFEQAIELEAGTDVLDADSAYGALAAGLKYADEIDAAREMFHTLAARADVGSLPYALSHLPQLEIWAGRWDEAEQWARRHLVLAEQTAQQSQLFTARFNLSMVAAFRGDVAEAEELGRQVYDEGRASGTPWTERNGAAMLGFIAMTRGDAAGAAVLLGRYVELGEQMHLEEPGYQRFHGDYVEALVALGRVADAEAVVERLDARATRLGRVSGLAAAARGRALLAALAGDRDAALHNSGVAVEVLAGSSLAYDVARAWLTRGVVCRRFKERGEARAALGEALTRFEQMGSPVFAERVRNELGRVGGRAVAAYSSELTPTETRVAHLAAAGRTTRQMADELFISAKTVEANLTRVYRKLGVGNRAQLANRLASDSDE